MDLIRVGLLLFAALGQAGTPPDWTLEARRFTGESSQVRAQAVAKLRATPQIDQILRSALWSPDRFLALDVIAALKLKTLLPDLIAGSRDDETGFYYLTINTLVTPDNQSRLALLYRDRLLSRRSSAASQVVLLDTLTRMQFRLDTRDLESFLFSSPSPEVRSAALTYLRDDLLRSGDAEEIWLLRKWLEDPMLSEERQAQALFIVTELAPNQFRALRGTRAACRPSMPVELLRVCARLAREATPR